MDVDRRGERDRPPSLPIPIGRVNRFWDKKYSPIWLNKSPNQQFCPKKSILVALQPDLTECRRFQCKLGSLWPTFEAKKRATKKPYLLASSVDEHVSGLPSTARVASPEAKVDDCSAGLQSATFCATSEKSLWQHCLDKSALAQWIILPLFCAWHTYENYQELKRRLL